MAVTAANVIGVLSVSTVTVATVAAWCGGMTLLEVFGIDRDVSTPDADGDQ